MMSKREFEKKAQKYIDLFQTAKSNIFKYNQPDKSEIMIAMDCDELKIWVFRYYDCFEYNSPLDRAVKWDLVPRSLHNVSELCRAVIDREDFLAKFINHIIQEL